MQAAMLRVGEVRESRTRKVLVRYVNDPVGYARDVVKVKLTPDQEEIERAFIEPPYKVKVRAGHSVGKTFLFALLCNWWFDTRDPGVVITTAPTKRDVCDLLWTEVRLQRARAGLSDDFIGPSAPEMRTDPNHWAKGYTAQKGESFQGRHRPNMLFLFDEDEGLDAIYYNRTKMMFIGDGTHAWGSIGNPYTTSSQSALEEHLVDLDGNPTWRLFSLSCLNHPNIKAELCGSPAPIPDAVSLSQIKDRIAEDCQPVDISTVKDTDFEFPEGSGNWYRPGPLFEAGVLGRRPTQGTNAVWSEAAFTAACRPSGVDPVDLCRRGMLPEVGCDVAIFGDDWTTVHWRIGPVSLGHVAANGWNTSETAGKLKQVARELAAWVNGCRDRQMHPIRPEEILVKVEKDGYGQGVLDQCEGWNVQGVSACGSPVTPLYPNTRSELWFTVSDRARAGQLDLSRLDKKTLARLRQQALAPTYKLDGYGRKVVEPKDQTKKRIGRSPDDLDGMNQAYYEAGGAETSAEWIKPGERKPLYQR
jgi:hypothetical protein